MTINMNSSCFKYNTQWGEQKQFSTHWYCFKCKQSQVRASATIYRLTPFNMVLYMTNIMQLTHFPKPIWPTFPSMLTSVLGDNFVSIFFSCKLKEKKHVLKIVFWSTSGSHSEQTSSGSTFTSISGSVPDIQGRR